MIRKNEIIKIYGSCYKEMTKRLLTAADLAAVIEQSRGRLRDGGGSASGFGSDSGRDSESGSGGDSDCGGRQGRSDGPCICIKPNLVCPSPARFGATTHPEIVAGIIEYLQEHGFENIVIAEGSWIGDRTEDAFEYCGYRALCEKYGVPFIDTKKEHSHWISVSMDPLSEATAEPEPSDTAPGQTDAAVDFETAQAVPWLAEADPSGCAAKRADPDEAKTVDYRTANTADQSTEISVTDITDRIDFLINVPVLKGHCQTKVTCALKNLKGLLPDSEKRRFHRLGLHGPIAHLQKAVRQDFIVVDHICGDLDFEEGGNPFSCDCIMAALDPVLTDSYAAYLLGYTPDDVPYIRKAEKLGVGTADLAAARILEIVPEHEQDAEQKCNASLERDTVPERNTDSERGNVPERNADPEQGTVPERNTFSGQSTGYGHNSVPDRRTLAYDSASEWENLPRKRRILDVSYACEDVDACSACYANLTGALRRLEEEGLLKKLAVPVGIGQGMQGKTGKLGIGRCTKDFEVSIPGCPPEEDVILQALREYVL